MNFSRSLQRHRRFSVTALSAMGLLLVALATAHPAAAAFTGPFSHKCTGVSITGSGSQSQSTAQAGWFYLWRNHFSLTRTRGCWPFAWQDVRYHASENGSQLSLGEGQFGGSHSRSRFKAFDQPPSPAEIAALEASASRTGAARLEIVPAAQVASTVIVNFPKYCELRQGDPDLAPYARFRVSNERILGAWLGGASIERWGDLLPGIKAIPGNPMRRSDLGCRLQPIVRVVSLRDDASTTHFKSLLGYVRRHHGGPYPAASGWPGAGFLRVRDSSERVRADVAAQTPGSISVVDLASARAAGFAKSADHAPTGARYVYSDANRIDNIPAYGAKYSFMQSRFWIPLETTGPAISGSGVFAEPTIDRRAIRSGRRGANCRYTFYLGLPSDGHGSFDTHGDWRAASALGSGAYPLCSLTYLGFWHDYADVYGHSDLEQARARTVKDYLTTSLYYGQNYMYRIDYAPLPRPYWQNIRFVSQRAITRMGWNLP